MHNQVPIILASASPRRRELLAVAGIACVVRPAHIPEQRRPNEAPTDYVQRLAREKCLAVAAGPEEIVLGADTTVMVDDHVLEKPADAADASRMLKLLSGRAHQVATGICLRRGGHIVTAVERTRVHVYALTDADIAAYIATGEPMDKAGAYGIQGMASRWIHRVEGCYFNVVGLPVARVWEELNRPPIRA